MSTFLSRLRGFPDHAADEFTSVASGFRMLVSRWRLRNEEVDALLFETDGFWAKRSAGCDHWVVSIECERRIRRLLHLDALLATGPAAIDDTGSWLRLPNPCIRAGRPPIDISPLTAMTRDPGALATIRDLVLEESMSWQH